MASSAFTKNCRRKLWFFRILDWICLCTPLLVYIIIALASDGIKTGYKIAVMSTLLVAIILTTINILMQKNLRCPIWIILIGLYIAIREWLLPLIIMLAAITVLDDLLFTPLVNYYHTKLIASKAIDERENYESGN